MEHRERHVIRARRNKQHQKPTRPSPVLIFATSNVSQRFPNHCHQQLATASTPTTSGDSDGGRLDTESSCMPPSNYRNAQKPGGHLIVSSQTHITPHVHLSCNPVGAAQMIFSASPIYRRLPSLAFMQRIPKQDCSRDLDTSDSNPCRRS